MASPPPSTVKPDSAGLQNGASGSAERFNLESVRESLIRQEDTIVFSLIERAKFPRNLKVYDVSSREIPGFSGSLLQFFVEEAEILQSKVGRYYNPEEHPFFPENLPLSLLPPYNYEQVLHPAAASININKKIWNMYVNDLLPLFVAKGYDGNYASAMSSDLTCLQALSRRIHYGLFVAEVKYRDAPQDYGPAIRAQMRQEWKYSTLILEGGHPSAPSLMERSGLAKENRANCLDSGRIPADGVGEDETLKRLKAINNTVEIPSLEQNLSTEVLENGNTNFQEGAHNQISRSKLVDKDRELLLADKVTSNDEKAHPVKLTTQPLDDSGKMPLEAQQNGVHKTMHLQQDICESICVDEAHEEGSEPSETSSRGFGDRNTNLNYNLDDEMVANEKRQFISSQNIASRNSQAGNWTEQSCCIKCDEGGQLLICSGSSCPMAVHEDCLSSPPSFEGTDFYCPFCSYTRANAAYRKAKQKIAIARKALSSFMCRDLEHPKQQRQLPEGAYNKESEAARNANFPDKIHANKQHGEIIDNHISTRVIEYRQQEKASIHLSDNNLPCKEAATSLDGERNGVPLVQEKEGTSITVDSNKQKTAVEPHHDVVVATFCSNDYLPCKEVETSVIMKRHDVSSIDVERNCVELVKDSQLMREGEHQQQKESPTFCSNDSLPCREAKTSFDSESQNVIDEKEDAAEMVDDQQHMNGSTQQRRAEPGTNSNAGNIPCIQVDDSPAAEKRPRVKRKHAMIQQTSDPETPASQPSINADETARNQNAEELSSNRRIKRRKAAKRYSNPLMPHWRRTKLLWTLEEEAVLKEAVWKFLEPGQGSLPWTKIMDFGNKVFHKTRTPGDLKDKWRNIMIKEGAPRRKT